MRINSSRLLQKGDHHALLIIGVVLALVGILGFVGFTSWQKQNANAEGCLAKFSGTDAKSLTARRNCLQERLAKANADIERAQKIKDAELKKAPKNRNKDAINNANKVIQDNQKEIAENDYAARIARLDSEIAAAAKSEAEGNQAEQEASEDIDNEDSPASDATGEGEGEGEAEAGAESESAEPAYAGLNQDDCEAVGRSWDGNCTDACADGKTVTVAHPHNFCQANASKKTSREICAQKGRVYNDTVGVCLKQVCTEPNAIYIPSKPYDFCQIPVEGGE